MPTFQPDIIVLTFTGASHATLKQVTETNFPVEEIVVPLTPKHDEAAVDVDEDRLEPRSDDDDT